MKAARKRKTPPLVRLQHGEPYCELCRNVIQPGELVAWWPVRRSSGREMPTAYCETCHRANLRQGKALR